jgi:hypothetical protein
MAIMPKTSTENTFVVSGNDHALVVVVGIIIGVAVAGPA